MEIILPGYTRVSDILNIFQAYAYVDKIKLKKSCEIGTDIHQAIESYFSGDFYPLHKNLEGYFKSFLMWADSCPVEAIAKEMRLYDDDLKITGKPDLLAKIGDTNMLIDFKTGSWSHREIWTLQGTFYRHLIEKENKFEAPNEFHFIQLQRDGTAPLLHSFTHDEKNWDTCKKAIEIYHWFKKNG